MPASLKTIDLKITRCFNHNEYFFVTLIIKKIDEKNSHQNIIYFFPFN